MKIGKQDYPGFVMKGPLASGEMYYGWEPSPKQRKAGWKTVKLSAPGVDLPAALAAWKVEHDKVTAWKSGGEAPRKVRAYTAPQTFGALLDRYEAEKLPHLAANTQRVDMVAIRRLRPWAGKQPVHWITQDRVHKFRNVLMDGVELDGPGHAPAFHLLSTLRRIFTWAMAEAMPRFQLAGDKNPAADFGLRMPKSRDQVWEEPDFEAYAKAAETLDREARERGADGDPDALELAFAVDLAAWIGQREADIIKLGRANWADMTHLVEPHDRPLLSGNEGVVRGFQLRQGKTSRWVGVPVTGALRARVELAFADNAARTPAVATVLVCHSTGRPWNARNFIRAFDRVRQKAVAMGSNHLAELQYRDLRRTCVVRLGRLGLNDAQIAAITGHKLETIKKILEVYMPRDTAMAGSAVVALIGRHAPAPKGEQKEQAK